MEFTKTETARNLAAAFAGESQARGRYAFLAERLKEAGQYRLADVICAIAGNELAHSKVFFDCMVRHSGGVENVSVQAGYPFREGSVIETIRFAVEDETSEFERIYPSFSETAKREGYPDIAAVYDKIASVEKGHSAVLAEIACKMEKDTLYTSDKPKVYRCSNCGFEIRSKSAFEICPLCAHPRGFVQISLENPY